MRARGERMINDSTHMAEQAEHTWLNTKHICYIYMSDTFSLFDT